MIISVFLIAFCITTALAISVTTGTPVQSWWITALVILTMSLVFLFALHRTERWLERRRNRGTTEARMSPDSFFGASGGMVVQETPPATAPSDVQPGVAETSAGKAA